MIRVAKIINTHGLKGECKLYLFTDDAKHRFEKGSILHLKDHRTLCVERYREQKGFGYCYFKEIKSIDEAELYKNLELYIEKDELPPLEKGQYYYHQLMDCTVINEKDEELGKVSDILETGANLVLRVSNKKTNFLLPFVDAFVKNVDVENKKIFINEMDGLR